MFKLAIVLAVCLVAVNAIPVKPNDMPARIVNAEKDSNQDLREFVEAWKNNDKASVSKMVQFIIEIAESGFAHSEKLNASFGKLRETLLRLTRSPTPLAMKLLATLLDGNRDNKSYYDLETVIRWIEKRQVAGVQDQLLTQAVTAAKQSQDSLQTMADKFVALFKSLKVDTSNMKEQVTEAVHVMDEKAGPFMAKFEETIEALTAFQVKFQSL